ncbi:MAG: 6-hydroxymethylpterin diphosphokinase MptE-like protein [Spirochaetia bacterium]
MSRLTVTTLGNAQNVFWDDRPLYSQYDPRHGALRGLPTVQDYTLYFVPSPLLGYGLDTFLSQLPDHSHLLVVEKEPLLKKITEQSMDGWCQEKMSYLFDPNEKDCQNVLKKIEYLNIKDSHYFFVNQGEKIHTQAYRSLFKFCQQAIALQNSNRLTLEKNIDIWLSHLFENLAFFPYSYQMATPKNNDPYVVVGAGPSLENALDDLKKYRKNFRLLAVDTALPVLMTAGINPDLVFVLESSHYNIQDFILPQQVSLCLCCDLTSLPQQARMPHIQSHFFLTHFAPCQLLDRLQRSIGITHLPALGSVGVSALAFALKQTQGPILYTGLDFSFLLGKSHARGAYSHTNMLCAWKRTHPNEILMNQLSHPIMAYQTSPGVNVYSDPLLMRYAQMASQGDASRIFCLTDLGLSLGYKKCTLEHFSPLPDQVFLSKNPGFSDLSNIQNFIKKEIVLLESFFQKDTQSLQALDYLWVGKEVSHESIFENLNIGNRAEFFYKKWHVLQKIYDGDCTVYGSNMAD